MTELKRTISLPMLVLYGLGVTIGAGVYVLIGEVAARSGYGTPLAFVVSAFAAGFSALSFGELASRFPESAGEAVYVEAGFRSRRLATLVGLAVGGAGILSSAAVAIGVARYASVLIPLPQAVVVAAVLVALGLLAIRGIAESVAFAAVMTMVEAGGLVAIAASAAFAHPDLMAGLANTATAALDSAPGSIAAGAIIAFFAFIGFEDMVNVAEEVREPQRTLPRAVILTLLVATALYLVVALVAVTVLTPTDLAASPAPLAAVAAAGGAIPPAVITLIAIAAGLNGILVQIVMAARVLYGLAKRGWIPAWFGAVDDRTRTPLRATACATLVALALALVLPIENLAEATSLVALTIFFLVDVALILLRLRGKAPRAPFRVPLLVPVLGAVVSAGLIAGSLG